MNFPLCFRRVLVSLGPVSLAASLFCGACQPQKIILTPGEKDLVVLNGCVISACNYLAVLETQHSLEPNFWAKILLVRYQNHPAGHAYCVWETQGTIYGYDRNAGSFPIPVYTREPKLIEQWVSATETIIARLRVVDPARAQTLQIKLETVRAQ